MPSAFLSHSHDDKPFVRDLAVRLKQAGAIVWLDEAELAVGESLIERIASAIIETDYVVAILSPRSVQSTWVQKELGMAMSKEIKGRRVTVLPVLLEPCDIPNFLSDKLYADFTDPENHEREFAKLIKAMGLAPAMPNEANDAARSVTAHEGTVYLIRRSLADQVADLQREHQAQKFTLVQGDYGTREYSLREVDKLTNTQRRKLLAADPEMEAWWRGQSPTNGSWPLFRARGGIWLSREQIDQTPKDDLSAVFDGIPGLLDWYLRDRQF